MEKQIEKVQQLNSLMVTVALMAPMIAGVLANGFNITDGANSFVFITVAILAVVKFLYELSTNMHRRWGFTFETFILLSSVVILFYITNYYYKDEMHYSLLQLLFYAIMPMLVIGLDFNIEKVLRYAVYISIASIICLEDFLQMKWLGYGQADLGRVYSLITVLICVFFHMRFYGKNSRLIIKLIYIYNIYVLIRVIMVANRGALLALVFMAFVLFIHKFDDKTVMQHQNGKTTFILAIAVIIVFLVAQNLEVVFDWLQNTIEKFFGSVPSAIIKMRSYIRRDDVMNGRADINVMLYSSIKESPIYGHGLNMFYSYSGNTYVYPHNFILQYLFEGGIFFAFLPVVLSVGALLKVLLGRIKQKEIYITAAMLVCQCFPKLLLSSNAWMGTAIWMLIVFSANQLFFSRRRRKAMLRIARKMRLFTGGR